MIDLHVHTSASDGVLEPEEMVKKAKEFGLTAVGICDHDQIAGIEPALRAGKKYKIEVVPGMELSCYWTEKNRKEFHILGYYCDRGSRELLERLNFFQAERKKRAQKTLLMLKKIGYKAKWDDLLKIAKGAIGKPHISRVITENPENQETLIKIFGQIPDVHDFIKKYMIPGKPTYIEKAGFEPKEAIDLIHQLRGVAVVAHPGFDIAIGDKETIRALRGWGVDGLEAIASIKTPERTKECIAYFSMVAQQNGFLITGGSDYHGIEGIGAGLGMKAWGFEIEEKYLINLKIFWKGKQR